MTETQSCLSVSVSESGWKYMRWSTGKANCQTNRPTETATETLSQLTTSTDTNTIQQYNNNNNIIIMRNEKENATY